MTRAAFYLPVLVLTAACTLPPEGVDDAQLAAFDAAVTSVGCTLETERQYLPVELQTGFAREKVQAIAVYRTEIGDATRLENGGFRLLTGTCAPIQQATPEPVAS